MKLRLYILFTVIACLSSANVWAQSEQSLLTYESLSFHSKVLNQEVKYSICLPTDYYTSKKDYPTVYMLHGLGDSEISWLEYGQIDVLARKKSDKGEIIPMIYVMPEGYRNYYTNDFYSKFLYEDMFIKELIPHIDNQYRVLKSNQSRATIGYSMGGFGAMMLALRNPTIFSVSVPLSISVRTDEQYMGEDSKGWNKQWGRIFGGLDTEEKDRITEYYKQNSPFHFIKENDVQTKLYLATGDDEGSLAYSNQRLHTLMRKENVAHEYRVMNGGHEFEFWNKALVNGLNFISDSFEGKTYRGDTNQELIKTLRTVSLKEDKSQNNSYLVYLPSEYKTSNRKFPVLYVDSKLSKAESAQVAGYADSLMNKLEVAPTLIVFFDSNEKGFDVAKFRTEVESKYRIRTNRRFRAYLGYQDGGVQALNQLLTKEYTCVLSFDASLELTDDVCHKIKEASKKDLERTWIYLDMPDKSEYYEANGELYLTLKKNKIYHEYRVRQGQSFDKYLVPGLKEGLLFMSEKFHK